MKKVLVNLTVLIVTTTIFFFIFEVVARVYKYNLSSDLLVQVDECTGFKSRPNAEGYYVREDFKTKIEMNNEGFRDINHKIEKSDKYRILFLGDSFTEALQVPLEETYARKIESILDPSEVEIISMGVSGFGPAQELQTLLCYGLKYKPNLVVLEYFNGNDLEQDYFYPDPRIPGYTLENGKLLFHKAEVSQSVPHPFLTWLRRNSSALRFVYDKYQIITKTRENTVENNPYRIYKTPMDAETAKAWELSGALLSEIKQTALSNGADFLLVQAPDNKQILGQIEDSRWPGPYDLMSPNINMKTITQKHNMRYIDLLPIFKQKIGSDYTKIIFVNDGHWNSSGHAIVAETIADYIRRNDMIKLNE